MSMSLWFIAGVLMLAAFFTPDGRALIFGGMKWIAIVVLVVFAIVKTTSWWIHDPESPGYSQEAVDRVQEMMRLDQKRESCNHIPVADWDDECQKLHMGNY
jgi:hypothetical protein